MVTVGVMPEILLEFLLFEYLILCFVCHVDLQSSAMSLFLWRMV